MSDEPLTPTEARLTELAFRSAPDRFLVELGRQAQFGGGASVGLLINGMIVVGNLTHARQMADEVDRHGLRLLKRMERSTPPEERPENWSEVQAALSRGAIEAVEAQEQEWREVTEAANVLDGAVDEWPAEMATRAIALDARAYLTLSDVMVFATGQPLPTRVAVMRVRTDQIAGWWLINVDEEGKASFKLWSDEDAT